MFIATEIAKPKTPTTKIPRAEIFATIWNSSIVGFFKMCQTLLHLSKKDFPKTSISFVSIIKIKKRSF